MLRRIFLAVYVGNTNPPEERFQGLLCGKELIELAGDSPNIFRKSNIGRNIERRNVAFCNRKQCFKLFLLCRTVRILHAWK